MVRNSFRSAAVMAALVCLLIAPACRRKVYMNPITKETQQPDKVLFDTALNDIQHGRYERGRLTLQTLMNTYDTSEYLAKAKLAYADSWYREGGTHGYAQAEAEYKDFILFYPQMEEAAEAQEKICKMQYDQMDKADRDPLHQRRAEDECRQLVVQFPNSKFAPEAQQYLRNVQEVLADGEDKVANFYHTKGSYPAAANRLQALTDQFVLYSKADDALMALADSYQRMGDNFENEQAAAYSKIVQEYPLSSHADEAKSRLQAMNRPVPEADPVAYARQKYEVENRQTRGFVSKAWGPFSAHPNTLTAARSGSPNMATLKPTVPRSVPAVAVTPDLVGPGTGTGGTTSDVTVSTVNDSKLIDTQPDARANPGSAPPPAGGGAPAATTPAATTPAATTPAGTAPAATAPVGTAPAGATPASPATTPAAGAGATASAAALPQNHTGKTKKLTVAQQVKVQKKLEAQRKHQLDLQAKATKKQQDEAARQNKKKKETTPPAAPAPPPADGAAAKQ